jgi:hypothetical protein
MNNEKSILSRIFGKKQKQLPETISVIVIKNAYQYWTEREKTDIGYVVLTDMYTLKQDPAHIGDTNYSYVSCWGPQITPATIMSNKSNMLYDDISEDSIKCEGTLLTYGAHKLNGLKITGTTEQKQAQLLEETLKYVESIRDPEDFVIHWYDKDRKIEKPKVMNSKFDYNITPENLYWTLGYR